MNNILYIIPDLAKVSGGPKTRVSLFKNIFLNKRDDIIEKGNKIVKSVSYKKVNITYVESATNRIALVDFLCLLLLRLRSKKVIVFIRDVYIEMFPKQYANPRAKITLIVNKLSNFYLTLISKSFSNEITKFLTKIPYLIFLMEGYILEITIILLLRLLILY
jgi:hypothetical protein